VGYLFVINIVLLKLLIFIEIHPFFLSFYLFIHNFLFYQSSADLKTIECLKYLFQNIKIDSFFIKKVK